MKKRATPKPIEQVYKELKIQWFTDILKGKYPPIPFGRWLYLRDSEKVRKFFK